MKNLQLIESQPRWRVLMVAVFAKMAGVIIHVEGFPFGSSRLWKRRTRETESQVKPNS